MATPEYKPQEVKVEFFGVDYDRHTGQTTVRLNDRIGRLDLDPVYIVLTNPGDTYRLAMALLDSIKDVTTDALYKQQIEP